MLIDAIIELGMDWDKLMKCWKCTLMLYGIINARLGYGRGMGRCGWRWDHVCKKWDEIWKESKLLRERYLRIVIMMRVLEALLEVEDEIAAEPWIPKSSSK